MPETENPQACDYPLRGSDADWNWNWLTVMRPWSGSSRGRPRSSPTCTPLSMARAGPARRSAPAPPPALQLPDRTAGAARIESEPPPGLRLGPGSGHRMRARGRCRGAARGTPAAHPRPRRDRTGGRSGGRRPARGACRPARRRGAAGPRRWASPIRRRRYARGACLRTRCGHAADHRGAAPGARLPAKRPRRRGTAPRQMLPICWAGGWPRP